MKFGLHLPTAGDPTVPEQILRVANEAEKLGLTSVWMSDGMLRPVQQPVDFGGGISITMPPDSATLCDAIETLTYVAARTTSIQLGTSIIMALFQKPAALARRLATRTGATTRRDARTARHRTNVRSAVRSMTLWRWSW